MKPRELPDEALAEFCRKWRIRELSVFGSFLRDDFGPDSDIDFLVDYEPDQVLTYFQLFEAEEELKALLGRRVDLVSKRAVDATENYLRRKIILDSAKRVYAA